MSAKAATVTRRIPRSLEQEARAMFPDVPADVVARRMYEAGLQITKARTPSSGLRMVAEWEMT